MNTQKLMVVDSTAQQEQAMSTCAVDYCEALYSTIINQPKKRTCPTDAGGVFPQEFVGVLGFRWSASPQTPKKFWKKFFSALSNQCYITD